MSSNGESLPMVGIELETPSRNARGARVEASPSGFNQSIDSNLGRAATTDESQASDASEANKGHRTSFRNADANTTVEVDRDRQVGGRVQGKSRGDRDAGEIDVNFRTVCVERVVARDAWPAADVRGAIGNANVETPLSSSAVPVSVVVPGREINVERAGARSRVPVTLETLMRRNVEGVIQVTRVQRQRTDCRRVIVKLPLVTLIGPVLIAIPTFTNEN